MANNRIAPGSADSWGQTGIDTYGTSKLSDGMQLLLGTDQFGALGDLRGKMSPMMDVQSAEMVGPYFAQFGGPWTPLDIIHAFNQTYYASHAFWTHFFGTEASYGAPIPDGREMGESCSHVCSESFDPYRVSGKLPLRGWLRAAGAAAAQAAHFSSRSADGAASCGYSPPVRRSAAPLASSWRAHTGARVDSNW